MSPKESDQKRGKAWNEIVQQLNISNAKVLSFALVILLTGYHGISRLSSDGNSCDWLLDDGRFCGKEDWQPYGCLLHKYTDTNIKKCFQSFVQSKPSQVHLAFVGDSRIRQLFFAVLKIVNPDGEPVVTSDSKSTTLMTEDTAGTLSTSGSAEVTRSVDKAHCDLVCTNEELNVKVTFHWQPYLDNGTFNLFERWMSNPPDLVVTGSATWTIKRLGRSHTAQDQYRANLEKLALLTRDWRDGKLLWMLQDPVEPEKLSISRSRITNDVLDSYNEGAIEALNRSKFKLWRSSRLIAQGSGSSSDDGLHIGEIPIKLDAQVLLNYFCNPWMNLNDGSCCSASEAPTTLQLITFSILLLCLFVATVLLSIQTLGRRRQRQLAELQTDVEKPKEEAHVASSEKTIDKSAASENQWRIFFTCMAKLALIMTYFYMCDRANFFMKENKHYSHLSFWLPIAYVFALGLFFTEESRFTKVLHRDQTDEWKGWMQLVILIYHMTGASQVLPIYMQIRVLVSAYLFLTGYGHFSYFWNSGDRSFVRFCQVLYRMNFMTVLLCLCMNRPYQFYYFVPLVTFWYVVVYVFLVIPCRVTAALCDANRMYYLYTVLKFAVLFASITVLYMSEVLFERMFSARIIRALFVTYNGEDVREWWFRWSLDRYSVSFGMVFAFLYLTAQKHGWIDDQTHGNLLSRGRCIGAALVAGLSYLGYTAFTFTCRNKPECNQVHPYIAFVPIVSFILLRNLSGSIRSRYSSFFAWFGRISLELFIGQYHVWLAADTRGVLVLVPGYPVLNVIVTSFVFVCVAHEVHHVTGKLLPLAVPSDWKRTLRNLVLFLLALVPIGIHDQMI